MTKFDQTSLNPVRETDAEVGKEPRQPNETSKKALRLRVSITPDDIAMLPLYEALTKLPSDRARRLHLRQILLESLAPANPVTAGPTAQRPKPLTFARALSSPMPVGSPTPAVSEQQMATQPVPAKITKNFTEEKAKAMRMLGLGD